MRFKIFKIFLLCLANIVLLVYTIFPHHHHHNLICLVKSHCYEQFASEKHRPQTHDHEHDGKDDHCGCILKQIVVFPPNLLRQNSDLQYCPANTDFSPGFQAITVNSTQDLSGIFRYAQTCEHFFLSSQFVNHIAFTVGLRAPPLA